MFASVAQNVTLINLTPVNDAIVTQSANARFIFPMDYQVIAAQVVGNAVLRARLNAPSFRNIALPELSPLRVIAQQGANPVLVDPPPGSLKVMRNEEVGIDVSHAGVGADNVFAGLWVTPQFMPAPPGPVFSVVASVTSTLIVGQWVLGNLVFEQTLPVGRYTVIGMHCQCNDGIFARLAFPGNAQFRPGVPCVEALGSYINPQVFRYGGHGTFGSFDSTAGPNIEILGLAAGAETASVVLDLIKVG